MTGRSWRTLASLAAAALVAGCASTPMEIPEAIRVAPAGNLQLAEVVAEPRRYAGQAVRWGGEIMQVTTDASGNVVVEVLSRRLDEEGRPYPGGPSDGRFQVRATPRVDQGLYRPGTAITVAGTIAGSSVPPAAGARSLPVVTVSAYMNWGPVWIADAYHRHHDPFHHHGPLHPHYGIGLGVGRGWPHGPYPGFGYGHHYW